MAAEHEYLAKDLQPGIRHCYVKVFPSAAPTAFGEAVQGVASPGAGRYVVTLKPEYRTILSRLIGPFAGQTQPAGTDLANVKVSDVDTSAGTFEVNYSSLGTGAALFDPVADDDRYVVVDLVHQWADVDDTILNGTAT